MDRDIKFDVIIYHGNCPDGLAGAWVFYDKNIKDCFGIQHDFIPPDMTGKSIIMVDIALARDTMIKMNEQATNLVVLDHHKSNKQKLEGLDFAIFDMSRSGAQMAWDYKYPDKLRPWFIDTIGDRDLWNFDLPYTNELSAVFHYDGYVNGKPETVWENMTKLQNIEYNSSKFHELVSKGKSLLEYRRHEIKFVCKQAVAAELIVEGKKYNVMMVVCPGQYRSDVGNLLATNEPCDFAVMLRYNIKEHMWIVSCRASKSSTIDLSAIVDKIGENGGGHPKAAGFTIPQGKYIYDIFT